MTPKFDYAFRMKGFHEGNGAAPNDPGGRTVHGISERAHPEVFADGVVTDDEIYDTFYRDYWQRIRGDALRDFRLALEAFDHTVMSREAAPRQLQRCYNEFLAGTDYVPLVVDGLIGPKTIAALNAVANRQELADGLYGLFLACRVEWWRQIEPVKSQGNWNDRRGWLRRVGCGQRWAPLFKG